MQTRANAGRFRMGASDSLGTLPVASRMVVCRAAIAQVQRQRFCVSQTSVTRSALPPARSTPEDATSRMRVTGGALLSPLEITVERTEDGQAVVADELLSSYGVGDTVPEAVGDLLDMMLDYYSELHESRHELSQHLQRQLYMLRYFLGPPR